MSAVVKPQAQSAERMAHGRLAEAQRPFCRRQAAQSIDGVESAERKVLKESGIKPD